MGLAMAANLVEAGRHVVGYDLAAARRRILRRRGGTAVPTCAEVGRRCDVVICSLPSSEALLQTASALGRTKRPPSIVIETSTLPIDVKERARLALRARGSVLLDCPLSGTGAQARVKDLVVYASGSRAAYRRVRPVLDDIAHAHHHVGAFGQGSKLKFVANLLVAIHNVAAAEALVLAMKAGLDPAVVVKLVGGGAGGSKVFELRGPMMAAGDYSRATMTLANWRKDMRIIAGFARQLGSPTPLLGATAPIYAAAARRAETDDTAAVCAVLEEMAGYRRTRRRAARRAAVTG